MKLKLAEHFTSIQGEGHLVGKRMFFIRFAGCTISACPLHPARSGLCDTDWSPKSLYNTPEDIDQLVELAKEQVGRGWVCITGGEPTDQDEALKYLCGQLRRNGLRVHLQTSGFNRVEVQWDWLTVSPKVPADKLAQTYGQELKLVWTPETTLADLEEYYETTKFWGYYLQPLWGQDSCHNMQETINAVHRANEVGMPWSLSIQAHKYMGVR